MRLIRSISQEGRENVEWNRKHNAFPRISYARYEQDVIVFVRRYAGSSLVCYSLNPRPQVFRNNKGFPRSARENEIEVSQNLLFDLDFAETEK